MQLSYAGTDLTKRQKQLVKMIEWATLGKGINAIQQRFDHNANDNTFFRRAAAAMELKTQAWFSPRAYLPASGPLLVLANHPYGIVDGLAISALLETLRQDIRIIVWDAIGLPLSHRHFLPLDLSDSSGSQPIRQNVTIRRKATEHLSDGGCIVLFPSGSCEVSKHPLAKPVEAPWTPLACKMALKSKATVVPIFVHGHNSRLFHASSHLGELVRRSLFLTETRRKLGATIACRVGEPILADKLQEMHAAASGSNRHLAAMLRKKTLQLASLPAPPAHQWNSQLLNSFRV